MRVLSISAIVVAVGCATTPPPGPHVETPQEHLDRVHAEYAAKRQAERDGEEARRAAVIAENNARAATAAAAGKERAAEQARKDAARVEDGCAKDRVERQARTRAADERIRAVEKRLAFLNEYAAAHCKKAVVKDFIRKACDDGGNYLRMCTVQIGTHEELKCPPNAPPELKPNGTMPDPDRRFYDGDRFRNQMCKASDDAAATEADAGAGQSAD